MNRSVPDFQIRVVRQIRKLNLHFHTVSVLVGYISEHVNAALVHDGTDMPSSLTSTVKVLSRPRNRKIGSLLCDCELVRFHEVGNNGITDLLYRIHEVIMRHLENINLSG